MNKKETTLRELVEDDLRIQLEDIWRRAKDYHGKQKGDTLQDRKHCETVDENLYRILLSVKKGKQSNLELFLLSAAACVHDIGKIDANDWEDHGKRARQIILDEYDRLGLDRGQATILAPLVGVHDSGHLDELPKEPFPIGNEEVNIPKLAAVFRLADMLDTNYQRTPEILSSIMFSENGIPPKWLGRQSITGWYLDGENRIILKTAPKEAETDAAYALWGMMKEEISKIAPILRVYGYPYELGDLDICDIFLESELKEASARHRPFPGMSFYTKGEAAIFRGRDQEIKRLLSNTCTWPISILVGESGAGKTSLIHAGLFPRLERIHWKFVWTRPLDNPMESIKKTIWNEFFHGEPEDLTLLDVMKMAGRENRPRKLLVVVDQLEDILDCDDQYIFENFSFVLVAVQSGTVIPNLRVLLSFREDALVRLHSRLLSRITGSVRHFPSVELERLTREGAKSAFEAGFRIGGIGVETCHRRGEPPLLEMILDDIPKEGERIYPPYVQIVAETLCKEVDEENSIITREMYWRLGGASNIVAEYLMGLLSVFGSQKSKAEKVLVSLAPFSGKKVRKSLQELNVETRVEIGELEEIMSKMIDLRIIRTVNSGEFEIIHDYLGEMVNEKLVSEKDKTIRFLQDQLNAFYQSFKMDGVPITSPPFLARLYGNRRDISIDEEKYQLILCTALTEYWGLGWYWLRNVDVKELFRMIRNQLSHEMSQIRYAASQAFVEIARPEDRLEIIEILHDQKRDVREAAVEALGKIAQPKDKEKIIEMLEDEEDFVRAKAARAFVGMAQTQDRETIHRILRDSFDSVRRAGVEALGKIGQHEDKEKIIEMLKDEAWYVRLGAVETLGKIAQPEDKGEIIKMLNDRAEYIREAALKAVKDIVQLEDKEKIIKMQADSHDSVRRAAVDVLSRIAQIELEEKIVEMLDNKVEYIRLGAVEALGKIAQPKDKQKIVKMLKDKSSAVRKAAVEALGKIAQPEDKEKIVEMLDDEDTSVFLAALEIFLNMAQPEDKEKIIEILKSENEDTWMSSEDIWILIIEVFNKVASHEDRESLLDSLTVGAEGYSDRQMGILITLSRLDKAFYFPYYRRL
jgi:HEAT repeat protein